MNTSKLVMPFKREMWEYKTSFFGVFSVIGGFIIFLVCFFLWQITGVDGIAFDISDSKFKVNMDGDENFVSDVGIASLIPEFLTFFIMISTIVTIYYLLGALYDDRKDRSILFWKSLPVSDTQDVLTKFVTGLFVIPLIAVAIGYITAILLSIIVGIWVPLISGYSFSSLIGEFTYISGLWEAVYFLLSSSLWFSPFAAWLLFASSVSKRSPFMWAIGPPVVIALTEKFFLGTSTLLQLLASYMPRMVVDASDKSDIDITTNMSKAFLSGPELIVGLIVAAALLAATIWLRKNRYEM